MTKGLEQCDKCDYFISVEEAYKQGRADGIDECIQAIEDTKSLFDNSTKWTMGEKSKIQNRLRQLKEQNNE